MAEAPRDVAVPRVPEACPEAWARGGRGAHLFRRRGRAAQARIDGEIEEIDREVDHDEDERDEHQVGRHHRDVDELHRLHEQCAETGPLEDGFGDDRERDHRAELQSRDGDHRDHGVAQRVAERDRALRDAAGAREFHVVGAHRLEHLGAHQAHDQRHLEQAEGERRHDQRFAAGLGEQAGRPPAEPDDVAAAERGKPAQLHGEQVDEADADQERRQAHPDERERHHGVGNDAAPLDRRVDPECDPEHQRKQRGEEGELDGGGHTLAQQILHRPPLAIGHAEFAARHITHEIGELDRDRVVEAEPLGKLGAFLQGGFLPDHVGDRIADKAEHREREQRHDQHHQDRLGEATQDVAYLEGSNSPLPMRNAALAVTVAALGRRRRPVRRSGCRGRGAARRAAGTCHRRPPRRRRTARSSIEYCVTCHNARLKTGGLALDGLDLARLPEHADVWEKVVRKLRAGVMPPQGVRRPDAAGAAGVRRLRSRTSSIAAPRARPIPGRPMLHRLNRAEYANAIRDLLALDVDVASLLPPDDSAFGFDNISDVLGVSPSLQERYLAAADRDQRAGGRRSGACAPAATPIACRRTCRRTSTSTGCRSARVGGLRVRHIFPLDGEYDFQTKLYRTNLNIVRGLQYPQRVRDRDRRQAGAPRHHRRHRRIWRSCSRSPPTPATRSRRGCACG